MKLRYKVPTFVAILGAVSTFVPAPASKPCLLGYYAHCSWTPLSTVICLAIAGLVYWLGLRRSGGLMTEIGSGADKGECLEKMDYQVHVDWWMKLFSLFTRYIEHRKLPGWTGFLPFYRFDCPIHGEVETYPHGYSGRVECPICLKEAEG